MTPRHLPGPLARLTSTLGGNPDAGLYTGVVLDMVGFGLMVLAWQEVARLSNPGLQLPYLASAGFGGLALVIGGTALLTGSVRARDSRAKLEQAVEMTLMLREIQRAVGNLDIPRAEKTSLLSRIDLPLEPAPVQRPRPRPRATMLRSSPGLRDAK